jgi:hypothetical protein
MNDAISKMKASLAYRIKSLASMQSAIDSAKQAVEEAEAMESRILASGGTDAEVTQAIMERWPRRFTCAASCKKFALPLNPNVEYKVERALLQALLDGPLPIAELLRESKLSRQAKRAQEALRRMRAAGVIAMSLRPDNSPVWEITRKGSK